MIPRISPHFVLTNLRFAPVGAKRAPLALSALKHSQSAHFSDEKWLLAHALRGAECPVDIR